MPMCWALRESYCQLFSFPNSGDELCSANIEADAVIKTVNVHIVPRVYDGDGI